MGKRKRQQDRKVRTDSKMTVKKIFQMERIQSKLDADRNEISVRQMPA